MSTDHNHLIARLPVRDRQRLLAASERVSLVLSEVLYEPGQATPHVYFPLDGFVSLITLTPGSPGLEVGMVGREGLLGTQLALGIATAPWRAVVQGRGTALRIGAKTFHAQLTRSLPLQRQLHQYLYVVMAQLCTSAACLRFHQIGPRLARWLLMTQDRAQADRFEVTHQFLSDMLGVRRVGVTAAAGVLQRAGLISYRRGELQVLDRTGLENAACSCYASEQQIYHDHLP